MQAETTQPAQLLAGNASSAVHIVTPTAQGHTIVIGSGPVGMRFVQELLQRQPLASVSIFSNEPFKPYNRVQLSSVLAGERSSQAIEIPLPESNLHPNFSFVTATIKLVDIAAKTVTDALGNEYPYDNLVFATGARAHVPNIPGVDSKGVYTFRNMKDAEALYSRVASARRVVVVGGGLLGIEAARGLRRFNTEVTLIQQSDRLMNRQLDDTAAAMLQAKLEQSGIQVVTDSGVREVLGGSRVEAIKTRSGQTIACDTVLLCAGIKPNIELARASRIKVGLGITVDDELQTSADNVYAIGECCEHDGRTYGLVSPGLEQAAIAAENLTGGHSNYHGSTTVSKLKVVGEDVVSIGEVNDLPDRPRQRVANFRRRSQNKYRKVVVHKGKLIGAVGYGEWPELTRLQEAYQSGRSFWPWQLLWFFLCGRLWFLNGANRIEKWPSTAVVCQCNQVTQGQLVQARERGCDTVTALADETRAGTVCGSCKPLLSQLVGAPAEKQQAWPVLLLFSVIALSIVAALVAIPAPEVENSVQTSNWFEAIWNDKYWKQVTGFSLLGAVVIGMLMSLRKRLHWRWMGAFFGWRLLHVVLGVVSVAMLIFHTGFNLGENLNRLLLVSFLATIVLGSVASTVTGLSHTFAADRALRVQKMWSLLHLLVAWPLPILLIVHIVSVYYF